MCARSLVARDGRRMPGGYARGPTPPLFLREYSFVGGLQRGISVSAGFKGFSGSADRRCVCVAIIFHSAMSMA